MRARVVTAAVFGLFLCTPAWAQNAGDRGLGLILGEPTGFCAKYWLTNTTAWDGAAAWSFGNADSLQLHVDYLLHHTNIARDLSEDLGRSRDRIQDEILFYYGIGGRVRFNDGKGDDLLGLRVPVGADWIPARSRLDAFFELVPSMDLAPKTDFDLGMAVGVRFYF